MDIKYVFKLSIPKCIISLISIIVLLLISELLSYLICSSIFNASSFELFNSKTMLFITLLFQMLLALIIIEIIKCLHKKNSNRINFKIFNGKQLGIFLTLIILCIFPQFIIFILNEYDYPQHFLLLNSIQVIIVCIVIFTSFKNSIEKEKAQNDLVTMTLHNKTMTGMVDGVRKLKHDYNNIMQALNGYVSTKQYDKLQEHINSVIGECNDINNLSTIDSKIFNDPAIYGIVGAKYFLATENNIKFEFDIATDISKIEFSMPDLSRILGILLDNAIEATSKLESDRYIKLEMRYDKKKCADIIKVYNTYDTNININTQDIFKKGFSSKKVKSGIGLWEVKKLIDKSKNSQIFATIEKDKLFVQNIIIEK